MTDCDQLQTWVDGYQYSKPISVLNDGTTLMKQDWEL